ncbi:MAG TPA: hypothetical protein VL992_17380 [Tepidisphaeraceae bacterium]|nr:hypothetical protein [Tepidisphaeraceae bacterium]
MPRFKGHSGFSLVLAGGGGLVFFWLTDPGCVFGRWLVGDGVDALNQARMGTLVGLAGSTAALVIGVWLVTRKAA